MIERQRSLRRLVDSPTRVVCLLLLLWSFGGTRAASVTAAAATHSLAWPPVDYRQDEASVRVTLNPAHGQPLQQVVLGGDGRGTLQQRGQTRTFNIERKAVLDLINALYRMRFFDLPVELAAVRSVFEKDDGSVGTQSVKMHDATRTTVCFSLPQYEKCVAYQNQPPRELEEWVTHLLAEGQARSASR